MHSLHFEAITAPGQEKPGQLNATPHPLAVIVREACEAAIKETLHLNSFSPRRLLTAPEAAGYLALSLREIYNMLATRQLSGVKHGRRLMIDIEDLTYWIKQHKAS